MTFTCGTTFHDQWIITGTIPEKITLGRLDGKSTHKSGKWFAFFASPKARVFAHFPEVELSTSGRRAAEVLHLELFHFYPKIKLFLKRQLCGSVSYHDAKINTLDGQNPANQLIGSLSRYKVLYISGGAGFRPSTVLELLP